MLLLALLGAACGQEVVVGGFDGEVETYATSSSNGDGDVSSEASHPRPGSTAVSLDGTVELIVEGALIDGDGREVPITPAAVEVSFDLRGDTVRVARMTVPVGDYAAVRLRFHRVAVVGLTGHDIPGIPAGVTVTVTDGAEPVVVDSPLSLGVRNDRGRSLLVDVRAADWLGSADPLSLVVSEAAFTSALRVSILE